MALDGLYKVHRIQPKSLHFRTRKNKPWSEQHRKKRGPNAHKANTNSSEPTGIGRDKYTVSEFTGATGPCGKGKLIIHAK